MVISVNVIGKLEENGTELKRALEKVPVSSSQTCQIEEVTKIIYLLVVSGTTRVSNKAATGARITHGCGLGHVLWRERNLEAKLGGLGKIVEIDESKIAKRKYRQGHVMEGQWVFEGIEVRTLESASLL